MGIAMISKEKIMSSEVMYRLHGWMAQERLTLFDLKDSGKISPAVFHKVVKRRVLSTGEVSQICFLLGLELDEVQMGPKREMKFRQFISQLSRLENQHGGSKEFVFQREFSHWALRNLSVEEIARYEMWFCYETGLELSTPEFDSRRLLKAKLALPIEQEKKGRVRRIVEAGEEQEEKKGRFG